MQFETLQDSQKEQELSNQEKQVQTDSMVNQPKLQAKGEH
jgi:hypothetical protein